MGDLFTLGARWTGTAPALLEAQRRALPARMERIADEAARIQVAELTPRTPVYKGRHDRHRGALRGGWKVAGRGGGLTPRRAIYNTQDYLRWVLYRWGNRFDRAAQAAARPRIAALMSTEVRAWVRTATK